MKKKYRIIQYGDNKYYVHRGEEKRVPYNFRDLLILIFSCGIIKKPIKTKIVWYCCNIYGGFYYPMLESESNKLKPFDTLTSAKDCVSMFEKDSIVHYITK